MNISFELNAIMASHDRQFTSCLCDSYDALAEITSVHHAAMVCPNSWDYMFIHLIKCVLTIHVTA